MRLLVTGGRGYDDRDAVYAALDPYLAQHGLSLIVIQGGATGADRLAKEWCKDRGVHYAQVDALWDNYSKSAGPMRNEAMLLLQPHEVLAFPGTVGTPHMKKIARFSDIPVVEVQ